MWRVLGSWTRAAGQFEKSEVRGLASSFPTVGWQVVTQQPDPIAPRSLNKFMAFENRDPFQAKQDSTV